MREEPRVSEEAMDVVNGKVVDGVMNEEGEEVTEAVQAMDVDEEDSSLVLGRKRSEVRSDAECNEDHCSTRAHHSTLQYYDLHALNT